MTAVKISPPDDLTELDQWVLWKYEPKQDGNLTKVPYSVRGGRAATSNPDTWSSFQEATDAFSEDTYAGLGFVFTGSDPFVGIDLDDCLNDDGTLKPWAHPILERFADTYAEISPSRTGVKIFARGRLNRSVKFPHESGAVEVYSEGRYFTVTGEAWNGAPLQVEESQSAIDYILSISSSKKLKPALVSRGGRNNQMTSMAGRLHRNGIENVEPILQQRNQLLCDPPLPPEEVSNIARSVSRYERPGEQNGANNLLFGGEHSFNDYGNAKRIMIYAGSRILYSSTERSFYVWDGRRFEKSNGAALKLAQSAMHEFQGQAIEAGAEDYRKFAGRSLDDKRTNSALASLKPHIEIIPADLDANRHLLNFLNGTVDLRTGVLREHRPADRITRLIHHNYVKSAACPVFHAMLGRIMPGLEKHLQKAFGYSLTGEVSEKVIFIAYGASGNNGKTTLLDAVRNLAPEYSAKILIDSLMLKHGGETNNSLSDLADLKGARFANTSETESGQRLSEGKLKRITQGMGTIKSVRKYENAVEFLETHKLWLDANHLPVIKGTDNAIWNRLHLLSFNVEIPQSEIDREMPTRLARESEGILAWIVEGARRWYREGLGKPPAITEAVTGWRKGIDTIGPFFNEMITRVPDEPRAWIEKQVLWNAYLDWTEDHEDRPQATRKEFLAYVAEKGIKEGRDPSGTKRVFREVRFIQVQPKEQRGVA